MKKLNWKLLLVLALAIILVVSMVACNPKDDDNKKDPEAPDVPVWDTPTNPSDANDVFFTELYNVSRGIGNAKIAEDKNVYIEADLGVALGNRPAGDFEGTKFNIGVALKAILDRQNAANSTFFVDLSAGTKTLISLYYTPAEKIAYVALGSQKVQINTQLVDLGALIDSLLKKDIISTVVDPTTQAETEVNRGSVMDLINTLVADTKGAWTIDNLISAILTQFGLKEGLYGSLGSLLPGAFDGQHMFNIKNLFGNSLFRSQFSSTNAQDGTHSTKMLSGTVKNAVESLLGAGQDVGSLDLNISFKSDENHNLKDGVKVSADLVVDPQNPLYNSLPGSADAKSNPFLELTVNHLMIKDASDKSIPLVGNKTDYKENLQLQAEVNLDLTGISVGMGSGSLSPAKSLNIGLYADLDLVNETNNKTAARMFIKFKNNPLHDQTEYDKNALDLVYKDGRLAMMIDNSAELIGIQYVLGVNYGMLLAGPVGNLIDGILEDFPTQKAIFDAEYWQAQKQPTYTYGTVETSRTFNPNFKGFAIDGLGMDVVLNLLTGTNGTASAAADPQPEDEKEGINIFNTLTAVVGLLGRDQKGNVTVTSSNVLNLVEGITGMDEAGFKGMLNDIDIVGTLYNYLYVAGIEPVGGANPKVADIAADLLKAPLAVTLDLSDGINLDIHLTKSKPQDAETFENHGAHIDASATIKFSSTKKTIEQFDCTELINAFKAAEEDLEAAVATQAEAQAKWDKFVAEFAEKYATLETAYKETTEYQQYSEASSALSQAKKLQDDKMKEIEAFDEIGSNTYQKGRSLIRLYDTAYKNWIKADRPASGTTKDALDTALTNLTTAFGEYKESEAILAKWAEVKPLLEAYEDASAVSTAASSAYRATKEYLAYAAYQTEWQNEAGAITAANQAAAAASANFYYWNVAE